MKPRFVHISDLHLGKKFSNRHFSLKEREKRREELWDTFDQIIKTIKTEKIPYLFIAGDLTEREYLSFKLLKRIIQKFKLIEDTKVVIACGRSDPYNINSMYEYIEWPENVYIVKNSESVQKINIHEDNLCIYSLSWDKSDENINSQLIYDISVDENKINLLLLHCDTGNKGNMLPVNPDLIKNKFDYCALGGKHNLEIVSKNIVYCGTPEPLSFDEPGDHGFITGTLDKKNVSYEFKPIAKRKFITRNIKIDKSFVFNKILDNIKFSGDTFSNIKDYVKINLTGEVNSDIYMEEIKNESKQFFYYIEFEENFIYRNLEEKKYDENEFNIIESYKLQFENHHDKTEQQAFELGLEVLRKEKVVK